MTSVQHERRVLRIDEHRRDSAAMTYVYPVVSRRAGGVSIGINLNPNRACNWRCVYCQVEGLQRGGPPPIDLALLREELTRMLNDVLHGDFMQRQVPEDARVLRDIAFSGDGEPTSAREFPAAVELACEVMATVGVDSSVALRLITNGSLIERSKVEEGLRCLNAAHGEVWFKLDAARASDMQRINNSRLQRKAVLRRLRRCAELCPTWVQTCLFATHGKMPDEAQLAAWLKLLVEAHTCLRGVHLYSLARRSQQPEASTLSAVPAAWLEALAARVRGATGLRVAVSP